MSWLLALGVRRNKSSIEGRAFKLENNDKKAALEMMIGTGNYLIIKG